MIRMISTRVHAYNLTLLVLLWLNCSQTIANSPNESQ